MKKTKQLGLLILGLLIFMPFMKPVSAQETYVGVQDGIVYLWKLSVFKEEWGGYFDDQLEVTLGNLFPLDPTVNLKRVYLDWLPWQHWPPQSQWPFNVTSLGVEQTGPIFAPYDNTTITSTPVFARTGWELPHAPDINYFYNGIWYIVNDTSSYLRQTLNLTLAFSPYGMMGAPFAPKGINWTSFVLEFLEVMNSRGGLYKNVSATSYSNGYSLNIPPLGFVNNTKDIDIHVRYSPNGVLANHEFVYDGRKLTFYWLYVDPLLSWDDLNTIIYSGVFVVVIVSIILIIRWALKPRE